MKLPKPRKLKSGNWNVQIMFKGERISHTAPTKKECDEWLLVQCAKNVNGFGVINKKLMTLRTIVDAYIESKSNVLSPSTIWKYKQIRDTHFQDYMDLKVTAIKSWQVMVNEEASQGYNPKTIKNAWSLVHASLKASGISVESVTLPQLIVSEALFLDYKEIETFVNAIKGEDVEMAALLALHSLRRSELIVMTKEKAKDGILRVRGAMVTGEDNKPVFKQTNKTSTSRRDVPIMIPRLQTLVNEFEGEGVLVTCKGTKIINDIHRICKENGLPEVGLHGLRHSFASLCYHLGLNERQTMRLGGWSDPTVLRKIYTHLANDDNKEAEDKIRQFFTDMDDRQRA